MRELLSYADAIGKGCPFHVVQRAVKRKPVGRILHIVWDKADGYPEHAWGYEQWTVRPFRQGQGCDGTIDENVHVIGAHLCKLAGLDYIALYKEAYSRGSNGWLAEFLGRDGKRVAAETIMPKLSARSLRLLVNDLGDINNHSLAGLLAEKLRILP